MPPSTVIATLVVMVVFNHITTMRQYLANGHLLEYAADIGLALLHVSVQNFLDSVGRYVIAHHRRTEEQICRVGRSYRNRVLFHNYRPSHKDAATLGAPQAQYGIHSKDLDILDRVKMARTSSIFEYGFNEPTGQTKNTKKREPEMGFYDMSKRSTGSYASHDTSSDIESKYTGSKQEIFNVDHMPRDIYTAPKSCLPTTITPLGSVYPSTRSKAKNLHSTGDRSHAQLNNTQEKKPRSLKSDLRSKQALPMSKSEGYLNFNEHLINSKATQRSSNSKPAEPSSMILPEPTKVTSSNTFSGHKNNDSVVHPNKVGKANIKQDNTAEDIYNALERITEQFLNYEINTFPKKVRSSNRRVHFAEKVTYIHVSPSDIHDGSGQTATEEVFDIGLRVFNLEAHNIHDSGRMSELFKECSLAQEAMITLLAKVERTTIIRKYQKEIEFVYKAEKRTPQLTQKQCSLRFESSYVDANRDLLEKITDTRYRVEDIFNSLRGHYHEHKIAVDKHAALSALPESDTINKLIELYSSQSCKPAVEHKLEKIETSLKQINELNKASLEKMKQLIVPLRENINELRGLCHEYFTAPGDWEENEEEEDPLYISWLLTKRIIAYRLLR